MVTFIANRPPTLEEVAAAREEFVDYVKIVIDLRIGNYTLGGRLHADGEKQLLEDGSKQTNLWGGGLDLLTGTLDTNALINTRAGNSGQDILNPKIRNKFLSLAKKFLKEYVKSEK